ncbi:MAG: N-acetylmuramoyl-L-alanine amidase [Myxococcaceae bacterium]|nr:N-acetylmuramoyl-L-alanine amidase [Myxococcaceae bacterium]
MKTQMMAVVLVLAVGCQGGPTAQPKAVSLPGARNEALRAAADRHHVPLELLMTIAYQQGRFEIPGPPSSAPDESAAPAESVDPSVQVSDTPDPVEPQPEDAAPVPLNEGDQIVGTSEELQALQAEAQEAPVPATLDADADAADSETGPMQTAEQGELAQDPHAQLPAHGMMYLSDAQVAKAAALLGASPEDVEGDLAVNVEAAAALLEELLAHPPEGVAVGSVEAQEAAFLAFLELEPGDETAALALTELRTAFRAGFDVTTDDAERLAMTGTGEDGVGATQQGLAAGKYPPMEFIAASSSNYSSRSGGRVRFVVIHDMEGTMPGAISVFRNPGRGASAHYLVRARDGHIVQMVREASKAWHAGHGWFNANSIGIEHEGFASRPRGGGYYTATLYRASAQLTCAIATRYHVPVDRKHIFGHGNVPSSLSSTTLCSDAAANAGRCGGAGHHYDPGKYWDWSTYMGLVSRCVRGQAIDGSQPAPKPPPAPAPKPPPPPAPTPAPAALIIDSNNAHNDKAKGYAQVSSKWTSTSLTSGSYGNGYFFGATESVSDGFTFWFHLSAPAKKTVDAWWTAGTNRSTAAPFMAFDASGRKVGDVKVNQRVNGGGWRTLGAFQFQAGWNKVVLSRWAAKGSVVIADAVRLR